MDTYMEGILYSILPVVFLIVVREVISMIDLQNVAKDMWFLNWHFTIMLIVARIPIMIAWGIHVTVYKNMEKENVVNRIRGKE